MPRFRIIAAAALVLFAPGCVTRPSSPVTVAQANSLPPQQLAELVLRQFAGRIRDVTRPNYDSPFFPDLPLQSLAFGTVPRSSYFQGLCEATVIDVSFFNGWPSPPPGRNGPVRAQSLSTRTVYKVIGEIELSYALSAEARERQSERCAGQDSVIAPALRRLGHRQFFSFHGDLNVAFGAAILQRLLREARAGTHANHICDGGTGCSDATGTLRALSLDDLLNISIERNRQNPEIYTVTATFLVSGTDDMVTSDTVSIEAELDSPERPRSIQRLGRATVSRASMIRD